MPEEYRAVDDDRSSLFDTITGHDPEADEDDDPILSAFKRLGAAQERFNEALDRLRAKSDPPPAPVPPAASAMAA